MNILVLNGSPKNNNSNTMRLTKAFLEGIGPADIRQMELSELRIDPCKGCFVCWNKTPGKCVINDDMQEIIKSQLWADLIIWSFPLYYFNVPGILKNMLDRQLPMALPFMTERADGIGSGSHPSRYDMSGKRHMLISTCGFYSAEDNYGSVLTMFDHILGKSDYDHIFCGQGELFRVPELRSRTDEYLEIVKRAGREYAAGGIAEDTRKQLNELLYSKEVFEEMADASWGIEKESGKKTDPSYTFTRQMAALYNKQAYDKDRVLEIHFTDIDRTYQIMLGKDGSKVYTDGSLTATTRIDTPFDVWQSIAKGEIDGSEALGRQMYTVKGDFSLMIKWDTLFGSTSGASVDDPSVSRETSKKTSMTTMLIPWVTLWVLVSVFSETGAVITLAVAAFVPIVMRKCELVIWDHLSISAVSVLSIIAYFTKDGGPATNAGYLVFGLFWLISCLVKEPLSASYVKYKYGGRKAFNNPIFMKTNYILAAAWGVLYVLTAIWTFFLRSAGIGGSLIIINSIMPAVMGIFTAWFEKWYPAWKASGKGKRV
ncbi:MAG: flavodoxin family protein [Clostridiales bacterium]|nr:flavodoxin family protein [Clostridiales bacterium]MDU1041981.1 flavodoxin family protein [Clostridiales bacterium]